MNPKTLTWIARSLDRIAKALTLIATSDLVNLNLGEPINPAEGIATVASPNGHDLYRDVFWTRETPPADDAA